MRATTLLLTLCIMGATASGCTKKEEKVREAAQRSSETPSRSKDAVLGSDWGGESGEAKSGEVKAAAPKVSPRPSMKRSPGKSSSSPIAMPEAPIAMAEVPPIAVAEAVVGREKPATSSSPKDNLQSGLLTAGSFDDNVDPLVFASYARRMNQNQSLGDLPGKLQGHRLLVLVKDGTGKPVGNARVQLTAGANAPVELVTRSDGRAVFLLSFDQLPAGQSLLATVTPPEGARIVSETITPGAPRWEVTVPTVQAHLPKNLDLAIVLDTTGSMGDELQYLKAEIRGIVETVQKKFPEVQQRFALVLYRDEGDEYVVRRFDFTASLADFQKNLSNQSANGGGDYPEAMHKGLEEANQLRWQENDTARLLFLVGDAPPHAQHMGRTMTAANNLRKKGIAVYPVACSGYDQACEFVMRSCAVLTGSQFLFLTNDSGIGNSHAEPTIPYYQVERLERLMVRMIASELSGQQILPQPADIILSVGKKVN